MGQQQAAMENMAAAAMGSILFCANESAAIDIFNVAQLAHLLHQKT
jgi:hypothetical protein